jgi:hypothetical protein
MKSDQRLLKPFLPRRGAAARAAANLLTFQTLPGWNAMILLQASACKALASVPQLALFLDLVTYLTSAISATRIEVII